MVELCLEPWPSDDSLTCFPGECSSDNNSLSGCLVFISNNFYEFVNFSRNKWLKYKTKLKEKRYGGTKPRCIKFETMS